MQKTLLIACGLLCLAPSSFDAAVAAPSQCNRTLNSIKASLPNVKRFELHPLSPSTGQPPRGRSKYLFVAMAGNRAETLMKENTPLLAAAKKAISSCPQLGSVSFGIDQTDWGLTYGLKNGRVQAFVCSERNPLRWGETYCP